MPVRRVVAHEKVTDDTGRVALQRGPIVYAAEWPDNAGGRVRNLVLPDANRLTSEFRPALLNGVVVRERARACDGCERRPAESRRSSRTWWRSRTPRGRTAGRAR